MKSKPDSISQSAKEELERRKLTLEIEVLSRKWWQQPGYWAVLLPSLLALVTGVIGIRSGYFSALQERIRSEQALLRIQEDELIHKKDSLSTSLHNLKSTYNVLIDSLSKEVQDAQFRIAALNDSTLSKDSIMQITCASMNGVTRRNRELLETNTDLLYSIDRMGIRNDSMRLAVAEAQQEVNACQRERIQDRKGWLEESAALEKARGERIMYYDPFKGNGVPKLFDQISGAFGVPLAELESSYLPPRGGDFFESGDFKRLRLPSGETIIVAPKPR